MSWQNADDFNKRQVIIKSVVVGDTAVGKTRLICSRTCNSYLSIQQMLTPHIPTVWAIDQYRIHKEVLKRSWMVIDGVSVSLRLWDTFGDHEKCRKFAYGRSDVVLLCFSISSQVSLKHCKSKWFPEIRQYCPNAPIVLVGCKNDVRHIYRDKAFLDLCKEKNLFLRMTQENDMVTPEQGRQLAKEIGAVYYESSVLTKYGVDAVYENAMRLALISRRQQKFWMKNLRNVLPPSLQMPYCPPKPAVPVFESVSNSCFERHISALLDTEYNYDVSIIAGNQEFHAHRIILAASSSYFKKLFKASENKRAKITINAFQHLSARSVSSFLRFLYSGVLESYEVDVVFLKDLGEAARIGEVKELIDIFKKYYDGFLEDGGYGLVNVRLENPGYRKSFFANLKKTCLDEQQYVDVHFDLEDGHCHAHRSILMARCDVMAAMFGSNFRERTADVIPFPGVSTSVFNICLYYFYTNTLSHKLNLCNCLEVIELANRLCLPYFISLIEKEMAREIISCKDQAINVDEHVFKLMETCQVHNADQLFDWCQYYIITNYQDVLINSPQLLRNLHQDYQAYLNKNRWPPALYLKELELYNQCVRVQELDSKQQKCQLWERTKRRFFFNPLVTKTNSKTA